MGKIVYVNGTIIIKTQLFVPKEIGAGYPEPPIGTDFVIEPKDEIDGVKCLVIDDNHPQPLFNEYYAKGDVVSIAGERKSLFSSYWDRVVEYKQRVEESCSVIKKVSDWCDEEKAIVYRMSYVSFLTALDAFMCYVLLRRCVDSEAFFNALMFELAPRNKCDRWNRLKNSGLEGEWEKEAVLYVQETSFLNVKRIDESFHSVGFVPLEYEREKLKKCFRNRHILVHRNGVKGTGEELIVTYELLAELTCVIHQFVRAVFDSILITLDRERQDRPKEPDIEEIFPGGIVRSPFKMSDLARLLLSGVDSKSFEEIELPML